MVPDGHGRRVERSPFILAAPLLSLGLVFLAELGDRSQLITMTYALRCRWWVVLTGVAIVACTVHGVTVSIAHFRGATLPSRPMAFASAIAFLIFAVWTWRQGGAADETVSTDQESRFALLTVRLTRRRRPAAIRQSRP